MVDVVAQYRQVRERVDRACREAGREPGSVRLLPVSKTWPVAHLEPLLAELGERAWLAENKVQEAQGKAAELSDRGIPARWSIVGHLQRNKARHVAEFADELQTLDSERLAVELNKRLETVDRTLQVLLQINTSGESQKAGIEPEAALDLARALAPLERLQLRGLMTVPIAAAEAGPEPVQAIAACYDRLVQVQDQLRQDGRVPGTVDELSMGMSQDFELAIAHGATTVRVGTAIFGGRSYPEQPTA